MTNLSPLPVPVYLARSQPRLDHPEMAEYEAGYWNAEIEAEYAEPISQEDWYATLNGHRDFVIYSEGDTYYAFDMAEAQADASARWLRARAQAQALRWSDVAEMNATELAFLAGAR